MKTQIITDEQELAKAFTEWERRWREEPRRYQSHSEMLLAGVSPKDYGESCAPYLIALLNGEAW